MPENPKPNTGRHILLDPDQERLTIVSEPVEDEGGPFTIPEPWSGVIVAGFIAADRQWSMAAAKTDDANFIVRSNAK
jgi:hypothetical protein